jgi:DNA-binding IclR family transcriptional regulator
MRIDRKLAGAFAVVPHALAWHPKTEPVDVMVWLALDLFARGAETCSPTNAGLAETVGRSVRTIKRSLARLEDAGFIVGESNGPHRTIRLRPEGWGEAAPRTFQLRAVS